MDHYAVFRTGSNKVIGITSVEPGVTPLWCDDGCFFRLVDQTVLGNYKEHLRDTSLTNFTFNSQNGSYGETNIPANPAIVDKLAITGNGADVATISNIVNPSTVRVYGSGSYSVTDGVFELTIDAPSTVIVHIETKEYLVGEFVIVAS